MFGQIPRIAARCWHSKCTSQQTLHTNIAAVQEVLLQPRAYHSVCQPQSHVAEHHDAEEGVQCGGVSGLNNFDDSGQWCYIVAQQRKCACKAPA